MFSDIIGCDLTNAEYDRESLIRFNPKYFNGENELQQMCWFDYRFFHPMKRTYIFAHYFIENFKSIYRERIDYNATEIHGTSRPKDPLDVRPAVGKVKKLTAPTYLWQARRCADFLGIPYDIYCLHACLQAMRIKGNDIAIGYSKSDQSHSKLLLSPSNLYDDQVVDVVKTSWVENQTQFTRQAIDEFYDQKDFSHSYQRDYEKHLLKYTALKRNPELSLARLIYQKGYIREKVAEKIFDPYVMKLSKQYSF